MMPDCPTGGACNAARRQAKAAKWPSLIKRGVNEAEAIDIDEATDKDEEDWDDLLCGVFAPCVV